VVASASLSRRKGSVWSAIFMRGARGSSACRDDFFESSTANSFVSCTVRVIEELSGADSGLKE